MAPVSKTKRNELLKPYKKEVGVIADQIQNKNTPDVYVYSVEDKKVEVMNPLNVEIQHATYENGKLNKKQSGNNYAYPVARFMEEEDIQLCADINVFLKQVRKTKPTTSVLLVSVGGILATTVLVKPKKTSNKGFA